MGPFTATVILLWLASIVFTSWETKPYSDFVRIDKPWQWALMLSKPVQKLAQEGYHTVSKITDRPFVLRMWSRDYVVLPMKYLPRLKTAGRNHLSFVKSISEAFYLNAFVGDLYLSESADRMVKVITNGLNPRIPQASEIMIHELHNAIEGQIGAVSDWKEFKALELTTRLVICLSSRIILGEELARDDSFISTARDFFQSIFVNALIITYLPLGPLRDLIAWPLTALVRRKLNAIVKFIEPIVSKRALARIEKSEVETEHFDSIEWSLDIMEQQGVSALDDSRRASLELIQNLWAASSSPGSLITEMLFQMLQEPKYIEPMRQEALAAVAEFGWNGKTMLHLPLQDSFMREVSRLYPSSAVFCLRTVMEKPMTFADGLTIPVGTRISFPVQEIQHDSQFYDDPLKFDGFRFAKLREAGVHKPWEGGVNAWTAANASATNLGFGYGNHVCPGRFHAVRLVKIIFTSLLLKYDIAWDYEGEEAPARFSVEGSSVANVSQKIRLRQRADAPALAPTPTSSPTSSTAAAASA